MKFACVLFLLAGKNDPESIETLNRYNLLRFKLDKFPMVYTHSEELAKKNENINKTFALVTYRGNSQNQHIF